MIDRVKGVGQVMPVGQTPPQAHAPGAKAGKIVTCTGILLWLLIIYVKRCRMPQYIRGRRRRDFLNCAVRKIDKS